VPGIDAAPPTLSAATAESPTRVTLLFSEPLDEKTAQTLANYAISDSSGTPLAVEAVHLSSRQDAVALITAVQRVQQTYTVTVADLADRHANKLASATVTFIGYGSIDTDPPRQLAPADGEVVSLLKEGTTSTGAAPDFLPDAVDRQQVTCAWSAVNGATSYEVQLATSSDFSSFGAASGPATFVVPPEWNSLRFPDTEVGTPELASFTYWWRVRGVDATRPFDADFPKAQFDALAGVVYVACATSGATCNDRGGVGNRSKPLQTISGGLARARVHGRTRVNVAMRPDNEPYQEMVALTEGVGLYGGYTSDWAQPDPAGPYTKIRSDAPIQLSANNLRRGTTVLEGFEVGGSIVAGRPRSTAFAVTACNSSLQVRHNHFIGGTTPAGDAACENTLGVNVRMLPDDIADDDPGPLFEDNVIENLPCEAQGSAEIQAVGIGFARAVFVGNLINSGTVRYDGVPAAGAAWRAIAIAMSDSRAVFVHNQIKVPGFATNAPSESATWGFTGDTGGLTSDVLIMTGNTMTLGRSAASYGIFMQGPTLFTITNNTIVIDNDQVSSQRGGIAYWKHESPTPLSMLANNLIILSPPGVADTLNFPVLSRTSLPTANCSRERNAAAGFAYRLGVAYPSILVDSDVNASATELVNVSAGSFATCSDAVTPWCLAAGHPAIGTGIELTGLTCSLSAPLSCDYDRDYLGRLRAVPPSYGALEVEP